MRLLSKSFLPILVAAALLLSAANDGASRGPRPSQNNETVTAKSKAATDQEQQIPVGLLRTEQAALIKLASTLQATVAQTKQKSGQYEPWNAPSTLIQLGLLIIGTAYTIFSCLQWAAIRRQVSITQSVEAPYLSLIMEPHGFPPLRGFAKPIYVDYWFQNEGRTPALIQEICANIDLVSDLPKIPLYNKKMPYQFGAVAIGPNPAKGPLGRMPYEMTESAWGRTNDPSNKWLFYGYVKYADVLAKAETPFGFGFQFNAGKNGFIMIDHFPYNYRYYQQKRWYHRFYKR
jgi:hypothetical protein